MDSVIESIRAELSEFGIRKPEIIQLSAGYGSQPAYAINVDKTNRYILWDHFHSIKSKTGLTPVVTAAWGTSADGWEEAIREENFFNRFPFRDAERTLDVSPKAILERAQDMDYEPLLAHHNDIYSSELVDHMQYTLDRFEEAYGKSPSEKEILALMSTGAIADYFQFEAWILDWQLKEMDGIDLTEDDTKYLPENYWILFC